MEYLVEQKLTPRQTCRLLGCDFYTVDKYAVELGLWADGELTTFKKVCKKSERVLPEKEILQKEDYRKQWRDLMKENPEAGRNILFNLDSKTALWLQKNDRRWYDKNSPPASYISTNWKEKDRIFLGKVKDTISLLKAESGKPKFISLGKVVRMTGLNTLMRKNASQNIPNTMSYLSEHLETENEWRKRKIKWAVDEIFREGGVLSLSRVCMKSSISKDMFTPLNEYAQFCIDEVIKKEN